MTERLPPPVRVVSRLLAFNPAWLAAAVCVYGAAELHSRRWLIAAGATGLVAVGSATLGVGVRRRHRVAWRAADELTAFWWLAALLLAGYGLLMLPTGWFTRSGVFALIAAAVVVGYARDLAAAVGHPVTAEWCGVTPPGAGPP